MTDAPGPATLGGRRRRLFPRPDPCSMSHCTWQQLAFHLENSLESVAASGSHSLDTLEEPPSLLLIDQPWYPGAPPAGTRATFLHSPTTTTTALTADPAAAKTATHDSPLPCHHHRLWPPWLQPRAAQAALLSTDPGKKAVASAVTIRGAHARMAGRNPVPGGKNHPLAAESTANAQRAAISEWRPREQPRAQLRPAQNPPSKPAASVSSHWHVHRALPRTDGYYNGRPYPSSSLRPPPGLCAASARAARADSAETTSGRGAVCAQRIGVACGVQSMHAQRLPCGSEAVVAQIRRAARRVAAGVRWLKDTRVGGGQF
jgi:hypothetical protein